MSNAAGIRARQQGMANPQLLARLQEQGNEELVMGFGQRRYGTGQRFSVAKRRRKGGAVVLNIDAQKMLEFRKTIGAGKLIQDIGDSEGVLYVILQDTLGILLASQGVDSINSISSDTFLQSAMQSLTPRTRFMSYKDKEIFEVVQALVMDEQDNGLLRIGLSTQHLREAESSARTRVILVSAVLMIVGILMANWIIGGQNYRALQRAYERIETYTGSILTNMTDAVVAVDDSGKIVVFNKAAERLIDINRSDVLGKECSGVFPPVCSLLQQAIKDGISIDDPEMKMQVRNKELVVATNIAVLRNAEGQIDIAFAVIKDLTEQKKLQENLKRKDQITAMGHLASGVAHEIRNPLNAIGMIAQRFQHEFTPQEDVEEYNQMAATMVGETRRINDIVQQFLQFARPAKLEKRKTDVAKIIADVATLIKHEASEKGVKIEQDCESVPVTLADGDKLQQVILNLVQNSLDACSTGQKITLACNADEKNIRITVRDNGKGISEKNRDKIFNMYFTTKQEGTGLGLSIVQQIVSLHDGTIAVMSNEGQGSTFKIELPITE